MSLTIKNDHNIITATIKGRIDTLTANDLEKEILSLLNDSCEQLILDISAVDYVSSAGLRLFILAYKKADLLSINLLIKGVQDSVFEIFSISGLVSLFNFT